MKKKLIVSGCSFTDKNFESLTAPDFDCSFSKWPELLAEKLDMECINLAFSGAGNNFIYSTLLEEIIRTPKDEIGLVIAAWSQTNREDYQVRVSEKTSLKKVSFIDKHNDKDKWKNKRIGRQGDVFYWIKDTLRYYITFETLCKTHNLPYKQFQMINPFMGFLNGLSKTDWEIEENKHNPNYKKRYRYYPKTDNDKLECLKLLIEYEKYIDIKNFIGWPTVESLGGYDIEEKSLMIEERQNDKDLIVSDLDLHPNKKGHEKIAEFLYGRL